MLSDRKHFKGKLPFIIALNGAAGSGKDTFGWYLEHTYGFHNMAFAAPLRNAVEDIFHLTPFDLLDRETKDKPDAFWNISPRKMMQKLGTEGCRKVFGEDIWIQRMRLTLDGKVKPAIITDCRFQNEVDWAYKNGLVVHITRADNPYAVIAAKDGHSSEVPANLHDSFNTFELVNEGTLLEYQTECMKMGKIIMEHIHTHYPYAV